MNMTDNLKHLRELTNKLPPMIMTPYDVDYKEYKTGDGHGFSWTLHRVGDELLVQRWFVTKGSSWESHFHAGIEIIYMYQGCMELYMDDTKFIKTDGGVIYINPNTPHHSYYPEDSKFIVITANPIEKRYTNGH